VATRPCFVLPRNPCWIRYGSWTSSIVSGASSVHLQQPEGQGGRVLIDQAFAALLGIVPDPTEQTIGYPWRSTSPLCDLENPFGGVGDIQECGGALEDGLEVRGSVEVETVDHAEPGAERRRKEPGPRVVAPTRVNRGMSSLMALALGPCPMMMSS